MKRVRAAVTGLGCICAAGPSLEQAMRAMYSGQRFPAAPTRFQLDLDQTYPVFEVRQELEGLCERMHDGPVTRTMQLAFVATQEALQQAALDRSVLQRRRVGVCLGTTVGCTLNDERFYRELRAGSTPEMGAVDRYLTNNPGAHLAEALGADGPVATVTNACSSGADAIGLAKAWLETGECDLALAGGCDELSRIPCLGFAQLLIAAPEPCRPFDRRRRGLNLGEGAGIVVLEREDVARERRAPVLAYAAGYATHADAYHPTAPHPEGLGLRRAIRDALCHAEIAPEQVSFVSAHGTSTIDNDRVEGRALAEMLPDNVPIVATKAYTGHTLGAAGALQAVFAVQALVDQHLPATAGFEEPDSEVGRVPTRTNLTVSARVALSNSLAFGGNNSVLVLSR